MRIIDILNKKANGTLQNGFRFKFESSCFEYRKANDSLYNVKSRIIFGNEFCVDEHLNDEAEIIEENKEIEELAFFDDISNYDNHDIEINRVKINELVRAYNKLIKEME